MKYFTEALAWLVDPANITGSGGWLTRLGEHLLYSMIVVLIAGLIAVPLGWLIGHTGRGRFLVVSLSGALRALPTLGVLTLVALFVGVGLGAPLVALGLLALPPILAGAYSGVDAADRTVVDAARAVGMTEWQILTRVEVPLGIPLLIAGFRSALLQVIATATLAAYTGAGGLGRFLFLGLKTQEYGLMLAGSLLVIVVAVIIDAAMGLVQRLVSPTT